MGRGAIDTAAVATAATHDLISSKERVRVTLLTVQLPVHFTGSYIMLLIIQWYPAREGRAREIERTITTGRNFVFYVCKTNTFTFVCIRTCQVTWYCGTKYGMKRVSCVIVWSLENKETVFCKY